MAARGWKRDLMKAILRTIFQGRYLIRTSDKNRYLVVNYESDLRHLRKLAKRAKELRWGEIVEDEDGIRFRLLEEGEKAHAESDRRAEAKYVRQGL